MKKTSLRDEDTSHSVHSTFFAHRTFMVQRDYLFEAQLSLLMKQENSDLPLESLLPVQRQDLWRVVHGASGASAIEAVRLRVQAVRLSLRDRQIALVIH
jgi:hypothetical protein